MTFIQASYGKVRLLPTPTHPYPLTSKNGARGQRAASGKSLQREVDCCGCLRESSKKKSGPAWWPPSYRNAMSLLLVSKNRPHDLNGEIVEFRQLIFAEAVDVTVMNDILFNVLGKTYENVGVFIREMIVFLAHCTAPSGQPRR
ncbi:MAG: hypothetical protein R3D52_00905 [Xanthobacteraceae bacterium]